ncbi:hypothetical protein PDIDSM_8119 [Penicillium digitatum]|nr:hypothetical protein PDIDSM_8119 [Penicillium digitatum]
MPTYVDIHGLSGAVPGAPAEHMAADSKKTPGQSHHMGLKEDDIAGRGAGDTHFFVVGLSPSTAFSFPLVRFFPELSSHFAIFSPVSADSKMDHSTGPSLFERELEERVQALYRGSADVAPDAHEFANQIQITLSSSVSDETLDYASSCYSHRSSVTSVGSTFWGDDGQHPYKTADAYSIYSPVAAGVFDDDRSISSSRPSPIVGPCHLHVSTLTRPIPITKKVSTNDLKNKPLPLEPSFGPSLALSHPCYSPLSTVSPRVKPQWSTQFSKRDSLRSLQHPATVSHSNWKHSMLHQFEGERESKYPCHTCGHSQRQGRQRSELVRAGHRARHVPTLSQASEELEDALVSLADQDLSPHTDGPLQISRHNGDLIATRPAPLPPSMKPHSQAPKVKAMLKNSRVSTIKSRAPSPANETSHKLSKREAKHKRLSRYKEKEMVEETDARNPSTFKETAKKAKSKKSFLAFRKQNSVSRDAMSVSSQSEDSLYTTLEAQSSDPLDLAPMRNSLLLRLPRLQTIDPRNPLDHFAEQAALSGNLGQVAMENVKLKEKPITSNIRQSWALVSTAQASSVQLTEQIYELPATSPSPSPALPSEVERSFPVNIPLPEDMPVDLILSIMQSIDSLDDLFNFALINKKI